jgi:hypothetical protein
VTRESSPIEVRTTRELAIWLGALVPASVDQARAWRARGDCIMVRDVLTMKVLFWPFVSFGAPPQLRP